MASTLDNTNDNTKYNRIAQILRQQIRSGELQPKDRLPSFSEMRLQHDATTTTVERVYSILEQEGLVKREKGRGIFVAHPEQTPINGIIGITGLELGPAFAAHPWPMHLLNGIRKVAAAAEKEIILYPRPSDTNIKWERVDGIINLEPYQPYILPHLPIGMPVVGTFTRSEGHISVVSDEAGGTRSAVEHLLQLGHRRIAYLITHATPQVSFLHLRITAYQNALLNVGITPDPRWLRHLNAKDSYSYQDYGYRNMQEWLKDDWKELGCTALLAQNDDVAIGAMQAMQQAGIRIPEDVSVIGFDGTEIGKYCMPHLTSVALPLEEIGAQAMQLLLQLIREEHVPFSTLELPTQLIVRNSTAPPKTS